MPAKIQFVRLISNQTLHTYMANKNSVKQKILPNKTCAFNTAVNLTVWNKTHWHTNLESYAKEFLILSFVFWSVKPKACANTVVKLISLSKSSGILYFNKRKDKISKIKMAVSIKSWAILGSWGWYNINLGFIWKENSSVVDIFSISPKV